MSDTKTFKLPSEFVPGPEAFKARSEMEAEVRRHMSVIDLDQFHYNLARVFHENPRLTEISSSAESEYNDEGGVYKSWNHTGVWDGDGECPEDTDEDCIFDNLSLPNVEDWELTHKRADPATAGWIEYLEYHAAAALTK